MTSGKSAASPRITLQDHFVGALLYRALFVMLACAFSFPAPALANVKCIRVYNLGNLYFPDYQASRFNSAKSVNAARNVWLAPGLEIAAHYVGHRTLCSHADGAQPQPLFLKVTPTQTYLDKLRDNGLDLSLKIEWAGNERQVLLRRDAVAPGTGRTIALGNLRSLQWANPSMPYMVNMNELETVPWFNIDMSFVYVDTNKKNGDSRVTFDLPSGDGIKVQILALGSESTALNVAAVVTPGQMVFGTCQAPAITINDNTAPQVTVDFGAIALDMLKQYAGVSRPKEFSIQLKVPALNDSSCRSSAANKGPRVRFVAAGRFQNGLFEGSADDPAYPGNSSVGIEISDRNGPITGANPGEINSQAFVPVTGSDLRRNFTATVRQKPGGVQNLGPFLIPVTVEAFYN